MVVDFNFGYSKNDDTNHKLSGEILKRPTRADCKSAV